MEQFVLRAFREGFDKQFVNAPLKPDHGRDPFGQRIHGHGVQATGVCDPRRLDHHVVREIGYGAVVGHIDGRQFVRHAARDAFHDGGGKLIGGFERGFLEARLRFSRLNPGAGGLVPAQRVNKLGDRARLPGMPVGGIVEVLHLAAHEFLGPPNVFAIVVGRGRWPQPVTAKQDARKTEFVPLAEPIALRLDLAEFRIEILAGGLVAYLLEPREVVDAASSGIEFSDRRIQQPRQLAQAVIDPVAQADVLDDGQPRYRLTKLAFRVGEVDEQGLRADLLHGARDLDHRAHVSQGVEEPARTAILAVDLAEPVFPRYMEVLGPIEVAVHLDGRDDEIGPGQRAAQAAGRRNGGVPFQLLRHLLGVGFNLDEVFGEDVHQHQIDALFRKGFAQQHIAHRDRRKGTASRAHQDNLHAHAPCSFSVKAAPAAADTAIYLDRK